MILRDPVHGLVSFESEEERIIELLIDTPEVQRLRRIRQLGVTSFAFPGAEHTRFSHAVGATFVMKLLLSRLRQIELELPTSQRITTQCVQDALAAALLHDVGHGPLSHLFEDAIEGGVRHETWTERIVSDPSTGVHAVLASYDPKMPSRVVDLVHGRHPLPFLAKAVSGAFDVDRCDYLLRDAYATGVRYGNYDLDWLLRSLRFAPTSAGVAPSLAIDGAKGLPAIEAFMLARLFMFQQVYLHKATRSAEWMIRTILGYAARLVAQGDALPGLPSAINCAALGKEVPLVDYLELDDNVLWGMLHAWEAHSDRALADLCARVRRRALFKTIELFGEWASEEGRQKGYALACEVARARGFDANLYVGLDLATVTPFTDEDDEPLMVVYQKGPARPLYEVSFLLGRLRDQLLTRARLVVAPEIREEVMRALGL